MKLTWLVVADNSKARIFIMDSRTGPVEEVKTLEHSVAREHEQNLTSDLPGRSNGNSGTGGNTYQNKVSPKDQNNIIFAKKIADELDAARKKEKFRQIILVAAPGLLGNLRNNLNAETRKLIYFEWDKNLSHYNTQEITKHLSDRLRTI